MSSRLFLLPLSILFSLTLLSTSALAHCPLCTAAVGTGLIAARSFGLDDSLVGLWVGAFIVSTAFWADRVIKKRWNRSSFLQSSVLLAASFLLTIIPLYTTGTILFSPSIIDNFLAGSLLGLALTLLSFRLNRSLRTGRQLPFQPIILVIMILTISTFALQLAL